MNPNILHVGLDVDDTQYHGSAFNKETGEVIDFRCRPTLKRLLAQLDKLQRHFQSLSIRLCYEASYVGFHLQRDLCAHGWHRDVVAPSSIPSPRGKAVKTDRIDAGHLAQFYANDLLTTVKPPDEAQEQDRDLLRTRQKLLQQRERLRRHMHALLRRNGLHFKAQTGYKSHWTKPHYAWLQRTIKGSSGSLKVNLALLLRQIRGLDEVLVEYGQHIEELAATPRYRQAVQSLTCYKGIKNIFALTMITEIGDIQRFAHPRQLRSWIGMDVREYSSGGKHNRGRIKYISREFGKYARLKMPMHKPATTPVSAIPAAVVAHFEPSFYS